MSNNLNLMKWTRDSPLSRSNLRRYRIFNCEPGFVAYQFGNYPTREPYYPNEDDWKLLDMYAENGVSMINVREAWSDISGYMGKEPTEPMNEAGFRRFIDECHRRGLKVTPYISPGYMDIRGPAYRPEWSRGVGCLVEVYEQLDHLCPGSPGHRARFFSTIDRLMDAYNLDGFYWDGGLGLKQPGCFNENGDNHVHFSEVARGEKQNVTHIDDAANVQMDEGFIALWGDFLCEVYARVKRRNGLVIAHMGSDREPPFEDKCWDYLLVGEGIADVIKSVEKTKRYEPYVLRFDDWSRLITNWRERDLTPRLELVPKFVHLSMAASMPYLQFPWLAGGSPGPEEDTSDIHGVQWKTEWDHWTAWRDAVKAVGNPLVKTGLVRDIWFKYLRLFRKMTRENTVAYLEVSKVDGDVFPVTKGNRRVSVYVNDALWVAIGHLGEGEQAADIRPLTGGACVKVDFLPGTLTVLRYHDLVSLPEVFQIHR